MSSSKVTITRTGGPTTSKPYFMALSGADVVLPVELVYFEGQANSDHSTLLKWRTATETNNEKFEIEESRDGREFSKVGEVKGSGTTAEQNDYSFIIAEPRNGLNYYRLKQVDYDGQFVYSKIVSIYIERKDVKIFPNPNYSGSVNVEYTSVGAQLLSVSVFDITGRAIIRKEQAVSNGYNQLNFDFSVLETGIYIVELGDGRSSTQQRLIISR